MTAVDEKNISTMTDEELFTVVPYNPKKADDISEISYSYWGSVLYNFSRKKVTMVLSIIFLVFLILSFICPEIGRYRVDDLVVNTDLCFIKPNAEYWFGTDNLGRDYWCQVWSASRVSLLLGIIVAIGTTVLGVLFGLIWGYVKKLNGLFTFIFNLVDNVPTIIYLTLISFIVGQSFGIMASAMILIGWVPTALTVRNLVLIIKDREFNLASRCLGTPTVRILLKNLFPQMISVIILDLTLSIPGTIAMESTLSFLGLGMGIETPSLGVLLKNSRMYFIEYPYLMVFPAVIVSIITITFYLIGNAFADASDPKNHR